MPEAIIRVLQRARKPWIHLFLSVCCVLSISHVATGHASGFRPSSDKAQNSRATIPDSHFAIGDFDGDRQQDLATVGTARLNSLHFRYLISFQLSKGKPQTVGVTGPAGGLVLLAQDVNGDRALDLVLVTAWQHELVGVLLNDGEGNFSAADPRQFKVDAVSSKTQIGSAPRIVQDRAVLAFPYSALRARGRKPRQERQSGRVLAHPPSLSVRLVSSSVSGRGPPRPFLHV